MRARRPAVVLARRSALSIVAGCATVGRAINTPPAAGRPPAVGQLRPRPPARPAGGDLHWKPCDGGAQCARLAVPLDYAPGGEQISLAIVRRPATKPSQRIGSLLINPGGPGSVPTVDFAEDNRLARKLRERFDIVGFDPHSVGRSTPSDCHRNLQAMYDADPTIATRPTTTTISPRAPDLRRRLPGQVPEGDAVPRHPQRRPRHGPSSGRSG